MAKNVLDIVINLVKKGGADQETIKGLVAVKKSLMDAATVAGSFIAAGYAIDKVLDQTVGTLVAYADQVRRVQNATGASAEDASKLIQILDDQKISYEQLEKAISKSGKAYDFSIEGMARMSEEYRALGSEQEKASFMQERFGKQWISFVPIMKQGRDAILGAADAVGENLILTQQSVDAAREYEISLDNISDSAEGVKISIGNKLLPIMNQFLDGVQVYIRAQEIMAENNTKQVHGNSAFKDALEQATVEIAQQKKAMQEHADQVQVDTEAEKDNAAAVRATSEAHRGMLGLITSIANESKNYADQQAELTAKMAENRAEAAALYPWQSEKLTELNQQYADMQVTYEQNAAAHNAAMGKIQYDLLITKLSADGLTDAEYQMAQQAGLTFGVFDQASINTANNLNAVTEAIANGNARLTDMDALLRAMAHGYTIEVALNLINAGYAGNGNGYSYATGDTKYQNQGFAAGGISTGPTSGHMELLHGTEAVIPLEGGAIPVQMSGGGGWNVTLNYAPGISIGGAQEAREKLLPFILDGLRQARSQGLV